MPDAASDDPKARIRAAVLGYLTRFPLAGDTTQGMIACWIPSERAADLQVFEEVVDAMVASGELLAQPLPDGRILYKRGPRI